VAGPERLGRLLGDLERDARMTWARPEDDHGVTRAAALPVDAFGLGCG
jgi:hypothetical protein